MPDIISDTTPIISLLKINELEILHKAYQSIIIPEAVFKEIERGKNKDYYTDISKLDWIKVMEIKNKNAVTNLNYLDSGEAEVIILAREIRADLVIIDEILGRKFAKNAGLIVTGTIGVLIKAKKMKLINNVLPLLEEMQNKGIWIDKGLKEKILIMLNE
ncbi:hypothetical protein SAMN05444483_10473 [Salegentibacter echinorum]|uniref:Nucleic acid-binding protein, contains PIN domain n=1 Tax=Salegentibacter echinorum TaxID=1073325 RepID=A0A1M5GAL1_SALEC|nr:DUF3368 domain-containing protein [Salegentibacter echinorum]SHG00708.1 hypothetical protein SAMN05444483_10473 [Salegentibacter echinorum]